MGQYRRCEWRLVIRLGVSIPSWIWVKLVFFSRIETGRLPSPGTRRRAKQGIDGDVVGAGGERED